MIKYYMCNTCICKLQVHASPRAAAYPHIDPNA
jgi:hypothetical protein